MPTLRPTPRHPSPAAAAGQEPQNIDKEFLRLWFRERCDPNKDEDGSANVVASAFLELAFLVFEFNARGGAGVTSLEPHTHLTPSPLYEAIRFEGPCELIGLDSPPQ